MNNLQKIEKFFEYDMKIKKLLSDLVPNKMYQYDQNEVNKYYNKLYETIDEITYYLEFICNMYSFNTEYIKEFSDKIKQELLNTSINMKSLSEFFEKYFSDMDKSFIDLLNRECFGYKLEKNISFNDANTFNELIHLLHKKIVNDEKILNKIPLIEERTNKNSEEIYLRGNMNEDALRIFISLGNIDIGETNIISLKDKIILMVRDVGHALLIEINKTEDNKYLVEYFIPKICNVDMVNELKGVRKVNENSKYTNGIFETNNLSIDVADFISKVPTDLDMVINQKQL